MAIGRNWRGYGGASLILAIGMSTSVLLTQTVRPCSIFSFTPETASFGQSGGTGSVTCSKGPITGGTYTGCAWTAISNDGWIVLNSGATSAANGVGTVPY